MRVLNTVYVTDHHAKVTSRHESLEVRRGRRLVQRFPLHGIDAVILTGRAEMSTEALARCARHGVRVASLYASGRVRYTVGGPTRGNVLLRVAQLRAADDLTTCAELARAFVAGKLQNQRRLLQRWAWDAPPAARHLLDDQKHAIEDRLGMLQRVTDGDRIRGIEGDATRRYFKGLGSHIERTTSGFVFLARNRRPPRDPVNALMSFIYGLLTVEIVGALDAVGLDPQVGYLHGLRPGRPSLALDMLEEFRAPGADRLAVRLLSRRQLGEQHFTMLPGGACRLTDEGNRVVLARYEEHRSETVTHPLLGQPVPRSLLPTIQATLLARRLRGDLPAYAPYLMER